MRSRQSPVRRELTTPDRLTIVPPDSPKIPIHTPYPQSNGAAWILSGRWRRVCHEPLGGLFKRYQRRAA